MKKSHPKFRGSDPFNPWWLRLWCGLASLVDGVIAVGTLGFVTSGYGADAAVFVLMRGAKKIEREQENKN